MDHSVLKKCHKGGLLIVLALVTAFALGACARGLSTEARAQVDYHGEFTPLRQQPELYVGQVVLLGGKIIETQVSVGKTRWLVLQLALDSAERPRDDDRSDGRYIVEADHFLDPVVYPQGTLISVVAKLAGNEKRMIGEMTYDYPVFELIEVKKWPPGGASNPSLHFGIGVGTFF